MRAHLSARGFDRLDAGVVFFGANRYRTPHSMLTQLRNWRRIVHDLQSSDGYLWHRSYWRFPLTIGLVVAFRDRVSLLRYARHEEHQTAMRWSTDGEHVQAGFIRMHTPIESASEGNGEDTPATNPDGGTHENN